MFNFDVHIYEHFLFLKKKMRLLMIIVSYRFSFVGKVLVEGILTVFSSKVFIVRLKF